MVLRDDLKFRLMISIKKNLQILGKYTYAPEYLIVTTYARTLWFEHIPICFYRNIFCVIATLFSIANNWNCCLIPVTEELQEAFNCYAMLCDNQ